MGTVESWDRYDDEEVHAHRVRSRITKTMQFLDDAVNGLEEDPSQSSSPSDIPK